MQGVLSRGDRRLAPVIWETEKLTLRGFDEGLARHGLTAQEFIGERTPGAFEPWDIVESGVRPSFYRYELQALGEGTARATGARRAARTASPAACAAQRSSRRSSGRKRGWHEQARGRGHRLLHIRRAGSPWRGGPRHHRPARGRQHRTVGQPEPDEGQRRRRRRWSRRTSAGSPARSAPGGKTW